MSGGSPAAAPGTGKVQQVEIWLSPIQVEAIARFLGNPAATMLRLSLQGANITLLLAQLPRQRREGLENE